MLRITRKSGESVRVAESALVAGKVVPAAPARRRGPAASYEELARIAARGWRPVESERLGGWELRAAGGFTRRANSALPLGDPGMPLDDALAAVRRWYAARGLPAYVQTATGAEGTQEPLCAELERRGWVREVTAELWTGALAPVADLGDPSSEVPLSREADEAWLSRYQRKGVSEVALRVLVGGSPGGAGRGPGEPSVWFATVPGDPGAAAPAAIGRCVVDGRWAGFAAVEVDPAQRRRGAGHGRDGGAGPPCAGGGRVGGLAPGRGGQRGRAVAVRPYGLRPAPRLPPLPRAADVFLGIVGSGR